MQAKQFWPPTKHKLLYANIIVYGVTIVLLLTFHSELTWAQKALHGYMISGRIPSSEDRVLIQKATKYRNAGKDIKILQQILERALQIEPYSEARLLLGICYLKQGNDDEMLAYYDKYRSINPSVVNVYTGMIDVLRKKQEHKAAEQILKEGIEHFRRRVELYKPYYDPNVPKEFNLKASMIHKRSQQGLGILEKIKKQLDSAE